MCLGIPGRLVEIHPHDGLPMGKVEFGGILKEVCLAYTPEAQLGDYVLVHVGFAISRMDEAEARETFELLEQIGDSAEENEGSGFRVQDSGFLARERDHHRGPHRQATLGAECAAVRLDEAAGNRQPQPGSGRAGALVEAVEDAWQHVGCHARPSIGDPDLDGVASRADAHDHLSAGRRVDERVDDEVGQDFSNAERIDVHRFDLRPSVLLEVKPHAALARPGAQR